MLHTKYQSLVVIQKPSIKPSGFREDVIFQKEIVNDRGVVGWCDGSGQTSSAGASYNLDHSRARAYCACSRCGWGLFGHFYSPLSFLFSFSLSLEDGSI